MMRVVGMFAVVSAGLLGFLAGYHLEPAWTRRRTAQGATALLAAERQLQLGG